MNKRQRKKNRKKRRGSVRPGVTSFNYDWPNQFIDEILEKAWSIIKSDHIINELKDLNDALLFLEE